MIKCIKCGKNPRSRKSTTCKECDALRARKGRKKHPKRYILYRLRGNARIANIPFDLTEDDIPDFPEYCPVFPWIKLVYKIGKGRSPGSVSVDRIDNLKGYVPGNIRIVSWRANSVKSDLSYQELLALVEDVKKRLDKPFEVR